MKTTVTATARLSAVLHAQGFRQGPPGHLSPEAEAIDRAACHETACPECLDLTGEPVALDYRPYYHPATGSYRALACCRKCGFSEEV